MAVKKVTFTVSKDINLNITHTNNLGDPNRSVLPLGGNDSWWFIDN